jgi:hypothetical protein
LSGVYLLLDLDKLLIYKLVFKDIKLSKVVLRAG